VVVDGAIVVNKAPGFSSTQYCEKIKTIINQKLRKLYSGKTIELIEKAGHTGTLDPAASGVLVILLNKATKIIPFLSKNKAYTFEVIIGKETDTLDNSGKTIREIPIEKIDPIIKQIENILPSYIGKFNQKAPLYSSKKIQGQRLYKIARSQESNQQNIIEQKTNTVTIQSFKLISYYKHLNYYRAQLEVECSQGTYIRSIIQDLSEKINFPLTLSFLVRKNSNNFTLSQALTIEKIKNSQQINELIIPLEEILNNFQFVIVNDRAIFKVRNGHDFINQHVIYLEKKGIYNDKNTFVVKDRKKENLAIAISNDTISFKVKKVLKPF